MNFLPQTEQQIRDNTFLPTGTYPFTVRSATEKISAGGIQTVELVLAVQRGDNRVYTVRDSLSTTKMAKLREAAVTCGLSVQYNSGRLAASDFNGKTGHVRVYLQPARGEWPEKNVISNYVARGLTR